MQDAQEIDGLLNFANGYFSSRALKYACFKIFSLVQKRRKTPDPFRGVVYDVVALLQESKPRRIPLGLDSKTVLAFTDGFWEDGKAGLGAALIHESSGRALVVQDQVHQDLLNPWKDLVGDHLICQSELFAVVLVRWEFQSELANKRVLLLWIATLLEVAS